MVYSRWAPPWFFDATRLSRDTSSAWLVHCTSHACGGPRALPATRGVVDRESPLVSVCQAATSSGRRTGDGVSRAFRAVRRRFPSRGQPRIPQKSVDAGTASAKIDEQVHRLPRATLRQHGVAKAAPGRRREESLFKRGKRIDSNDVRKYLKDFHDNGRNLHVFTHKSPDQADRELILRALLEMKNDIMEIKHILGQQNQNISSPLANRALEASLDSDILDDNKSVVPIDEMEQRMIAGALERFEGNRRLAARALKISERTLYRKIKEYGLDR